MNDCNVSASVLAGGRSTRMGQDKALVEVGGRAMIERAVTAVRSLVSDVTVVGGAPDRCGFLGVPVHADAVPSCGPLGGIYTALLHARHDHCVIVACDLPFLSPAILGYLCEHGPAFDVLVFESDSGVEPLCGVYSKRVLGAVRARIDAGRYGAADFCASADARIVNLASVFPLDGAAALSNVNTPEDLEAAAKRAATLPPDARRPHES